MTWIIDPSHSVVEFSVKHMMVATVKGRFEKVSGSIELDDVNPSASKVEATIETSSINTSDEKRDGHLKSGDFFEVEKYPTITFTSTSVKKVSDGEYKAEGDLTMHGVTRPVTLEIEYSGQAKGPYGDTRAGFSAHTSVNRKDFGLNWNVGLEAGGVLVSEKVNINLEISAVLQVAAAQTA